MRRALLALSMLLLLPGLTGMAEAARRHAPRRAPKVFTFHGSGNGHGIGMSQYGALGLARNGWSAKQIVGHYYTGVKVVGRQPPEEVVRVGLLQGAGSVRLIAAKGPFDLVLQNGETIESVPDGERRTVEVTAERQYRILQPNGTVVGEHAWGGPGNDLIARLVQDSRIRVAEWGHDIAHGEIRFDAAAASSAHVLAVMPVEDYLLGISEVPNSWPKEALGAQAIAARTYAYWRLAGAERSGCGCDVYSTTADQNYTGWDKETASGAARWADAIRDTARVVVTYGGAYIYAVYSSSSGGYTENIEKVWPGAQALPYLRGVCDPGDNVADNPSRFWSVAMQPTTVTSNLKPFTGNIGQVVGFEGYDRGVSGRVTFVNVIGTGGSTVIEGWDVRSGLSLKDTRFSVNRNLNISGDIRSAYDRMRCKPGRAISASKKVNGGSWQEFVNGRLYSHDRRDAVTWLRGGLLATYLQAGGHTSKLRLPFRVRHVKGGQRAWFDGGSITCAGGCKVRYA